MHILFILHGSLSHINSCLGIIKILTKQNNTVTIASSSVVSEHVENLGLPFILTEGMPFGLGFEDLITNSHIKRLKLRSTDRLYNVRRRSLLRALDQCNPNMIFLDRLYISDCLIIDTWKRKNNLITILINTMPFLGRVKSSPPINCSCVPTSSFQVDYLWFVYNLRKCVKRYLDQVRYLFYDDLSILARKYKKNLQFSTKYLLLYKNTLSYDFQGFPELILLPEEFEFSVPQSSDRQIYYVGNQFFLDRQEKSDVSRHQEITALLDRIKQKKDKLIYCSFGSLYERYPFKIKRFLKKLISAVARIHKVQVILSLKDEILKRINLNFPKNIHVFHFVPQLKVLGQSDLFISHGGLNSIKEAIHFSVPLLIYPLNLRWDQPGNSARVQFHNLGLQGSMSRDSDLDLYKKINKLLNQSSIFDQGLKSMKDLEEKYTEEKFLEVLYHLLNKTYQIDPKTLLGMRQE